MKLTLILLIAFAVQATANVYSQQVSLSVSNAPIGEVMMDIRKQTGYDFLFDEQALKSAKPITLKVFRMEIDQVLPLIFAGQPFDYRLNDKIITLTPKKQPVIIEAQLLTITGTVTDSTGTPLRGVTVRIKDTNRSTATNGDGHYRLDRVPENAVLIFHLLGYAPQEIPAERSEINVALKMVTTELAVAELNISTGFQTLPKERATGSFVQIDNELINRSVSTNILDRLDGVTSGLIFTKSPNIASGLQQSSIEIRGRSTLFSGAEPLVVLDNFPYDGELSNINPNDIENITVLKDAAAASVWGARSGNGVIVITTKKGSLNTAPKINLTANVNIGGKPDLYYLPQLSSAQYIEVEQFLYDQGAFSANIDNGFSALSPAVEVFHATSSGLISSSDSLSLINSLKGYDVRQQQLEYYYRPSVNQQYQASISGGGAAQNYFVSIGYDKNLPNEVTSGQERLTLNANNTYHLLKDKLELNAGIIYTNGKTTSGATAGGLPYPYTQIADAQGNALVVARTLRPSYAESAGDGKLLDWLYRPLDELNNRYSTSTSTLNDYRLNTSLKYKIINGLNAVAYYTYGKGVREGETLHELESWYTRNQINTFAQINATTGAVTYPLPLGAILFTNGSSLTTHNGRFQVNYENQWGRHAVNALAGSEVRDYSVLASNNSYYGYDPGTRTNRNVAVNTTVDFPYFYGAGAGRIVISPAQLGTTDRFVSYYFNGSYTYSDRYIASFSVRKDESNIFGVATNQKGVPLWSAGLAWAIDQEGFYKLGWLPRMKLRTTFGYTGNVNNSVSAYLTATSTTGGVYNTYYATIQNPPNPSLRWEKNRNINLGLDFAAKGNRISGSIDWWSKKGLDLIGRSPIAPQTGIALYTGNSAHTLTKGVDVELSSINLNGSFKWHTTLLYNYVHSEVTDYKVDNGSNYNVVSANYTNPLVGYPYYALFSFRYTGLNSTGDPYGYLNGEVSTDYTAIRNSTNREELVYSGSAVPTSFGSLRNTYMYKGFDISFNVLYKFGYYFRRNSLNNGSLYNSSPNHEMADYDKRWQNPGDELITNVPALIYPSNLARTEMYQFSDVLVEQGDHIRLRDLRLGYTLPSGLFSTVRSINLFVYANNLAILWRANKQNIDPDFVTGIPSPRTVAFGLRADL